MGKTERHIGNTGVVSLTLLAVIFRTLKSNDHTCIFVSKLAHYWRSKEKASRDTVHSQKLPFLHEHKQKNCDDAGK